MEVRDVVKLKEEYYWAMLARETTKTVDRHQQAKQAAGRLSCRQKLKLGGVQEAMENDYWSTSKNCPAPTLFTVWTF